VWAAVYRRLRNFDTLTSSAIGLVGFALAFLLPFVCFGPILIGTWRSLRRAKKGSSALLANLTELAQIGVLVTAGFTVLWATFDLPKSLRALAYASKQQRQEPQWSVRADGYRLRITGPIEGGLFAAVDKALAGNSTIRIVVLDSPGGDVDEATRVAKTVRRKHLSTGVSRECSSACTTIFAAGTTRILLPPGKLGFHGCRVDVLSYFPCSNSAEDELLVSYGLDRAFVHKASEISPEEIWYPPTAELLAAHVITSTTVPPGIRSSQ
jgi:hypothetical protein